MLISTAEAHTARTGEGGSLNFLTYFPSYLGGFELQLYMKFPLKSWSAITDVTHGHASAQGYQSTHQKHLNKATISPYITGAHKNTDIISHPKRHNILS